MRDFPERAKQQERTPPMVMDDLDSEVSYLMEQLEGEPGDVHEIFFRLHQILETLRAEGMPVPATLAKLESELDARFKDEAGG